MDLHNLEQKLFDDISQLIEQGRRTISTQANSTAILTFWQIGKRVNDVILKNKRAEYGKQIVSTLSTQLKTKYGKSFEFRNLRRMMQFADDFSDIEIVSTLSTQLSWSHFMELLPLKTDEARLFYAKDAAERNLGVRELRQTISRKEFERKEIANTQIVISDKIPLDTFKDPYLFDKNEPIGLILCAEGNREQIELLEMDKAGIMVAQYWTAFPPKAEFERKIHMILAEARERLERRKILIGAESKITEAEEQ